jgi:hypothetical protein
LREQKKRAKAFVNQFDLVARLGLGVERGVTDLDAVSKGWASAADMDAAEKHDLAKAAVREYREAEQVRRKGQAALQVFGTGASLSMVASQRRVMGFENRLNAQERARIQRAVELVRSPAVKLSKIWFAAEKVVAGFAEEVGAEPAVYRSFAASTRAQLETHKEFHQGKYKYYASEIMKACHPTRPPVHPSAPPDHAPARPPRAHLQRS